MTHNTRMFAAIAKVSALIACMLLAAAPASADADTAGTEKQIKAKNAQAMENFDLLEFEEAKRLLNEAVGMAKKANLSSPIVARTYVNLGVVYFSGFQDVESAKLAFIEAVQIDSEIDIDKVYRTAEMTRILGETKKEYAGKKPAAAAEAEPAAGGGDVDCKSLEGLDHQLLEQAKAGRAAKISAMVGADLNAAKVSLFYRPAGSAQFSEVEMKRTGECKFAGTLPAKAIKGDSFHYYIAAFNKKGKALASKGSSDSPNIVEVLAVAGGSGGGKAGLVGDDENPLGADEEPDTGKTAASTTVADDSAGEVEGGAKPSKSGHAKLFLAVAMGTGGGYVTGATEQAQSDVGCCFAPALLHLFPEIGYFLRRNMSVSAAFRMGFPVGANLPGHATAAPAALVRFKYALDESGEGVNVTGAVGGGIIRHTIKLNMPSADGDTDTVASGPILIGAGAGYAKALGGPMRFVAELNTLAGIPGPIKELGTCPGAGCVKPNFALQFDLNIGVLFAF